MSVSNAQIPQKKNKKKKDKLLHKCFTMNKVFDLQDWLLLHRLDHGEARLKILQFYSVKIFL